MLVVTVVIMTVRTYSLLILVGVFTALCTIGRQGVIREGPMYYAESTRILVFIKNFIQRQ